jgi:hypothetical protein
VKGVTAALVSRVGRAGQESWLIFEHLLFGNRKLCYSVRIGGHESAPIEVGWRGAGKGKQIFIWIHCNPLKSPESAKGIQGDPNLFICIGLAWRMRSKSGEIRG